MTGIAQATVTSQQLLVSSTKTKQDRKIRGPSDINVTVNTSETSPTPANQNAMQTDVDFDADLAFTPKRSGFKCNPAQLAGTTTEQARAVCGAAEVGSGAAFSCSAVGGCGVSQLPIQVVAFDGVPVGGNPQFILHARIAAAGTTLVLPGILIQSPLGAPYGKRLQVSVPDTTLTGQHLRSFQTMVPVIKTSTGGKAASAAKKKKKKKPATYYISAKCSNRTWDFKETTQFRAGGGTFTASAQVPCTQKKAKKKKK